MPVSEKQQLSTVLSTDSFGHQLTSAFLKSAEKEKVMTKKNLHYGWSIVGLL